MTDQAYNIFLALSIGTIVLIGIGLTIRAMYWRRKIEELKRQGR